jgi:hypothetical protein
MELSKRVLEVLILDIYHETVGDDEIQKGNV